jgi:outer membrane protein TolC
MKPNIAICATAASAILLLPVNIQAQVDDTKLYDTAQQQKNNRIFPALENKPETSGVANTRQDLSGKGMNVWSLQECIDYANECNLEVKMRQTGIRQQEVNLNTARNRRLPDFSTNVSHTLSFGRSASGYDNTYQDRNSNSTQWSASTSVPVFSGFRINNEIAVTKLDLQAAAAELETTKESMEITVTTAYLQILYNKEILEIANKQANLSRKQLERAKKNVR